MMTVLIVLTIVLHCILTTGTVLVWMSAKKSAPEMLPKIFFLSMGVRLFASIILFAVGVYLLRGDMEPMKLFTVVFIAAYLLMLLFDTAFFYWSSQQLNKK